MSLKARNVTRKYNDDGTPFEPPAQLKEGSVIFLQGPKLQKTVKRVGTGGYPGPGDTVSVHYVGTLEDGTVFDSSRRKKKVFQFTLGQGSVIQAWESAVGTMQVGEMIELKAAPEFCYGTVGSPPAIPPNATLTFEIELLEFYAPSIIEFLVKNGFYLVLMLGVLFFLLHHFVLPHGVMPKTELKHGGSW